MSEERGKYQHGNAGNQYATKPEAEKMSAMVQVRTTQAHKEHMQAKAAATGKSLNEWILNMIERAEKLSASHKYAARSSKLLVTLTFQTQEEAEKQVAEWEERFPQSERDSEARPYWFEIQYWAVPVGQPRPDRYPTPFDNKDMAEEYVTLGNEDAVDIDFGGDETKWLTTENASRWVLMTPAEYAVHIE